MKDGDRFIIHEFFVCEESKTAIVADFYIKKNMGALLLLAQEQKTVMLGVWMLVTLLLALQLSSSAHPITTAGALLCYALLLCSIKSPNLSCHEFMAMPSTALEQFILFSSLCRLL